MLSNQDELQTVIKTDRRPAKFPFLWHGQVKAVDSERMTSWQAATFLPLPPHSAHRFPPGWAGLSNPLQSFFWLEKLHFSWRGNSEKHPRGLSNTIGFRQKKVTFVWLFFSSTWVWKGKVKALKNLYACGKSAHFFPPLVTAHQPTQIGSQSGSSLFHSSSIYDFHCQREAVFF